MSVLRALASSPRAAAATLRTRAANLDAQDVAEADRLGRSAVLDLPDEETSESADATPGADGDAEDGRVTRVGLTAEGEARLNKLAPAHLDELRNLAPVLDQLVAGWAAHDPDGHR